jgi:small GTP-binding protein
MDFHKILVIGDVAVGKTSLVNRVVYNSFSEKYKATIGCEFGIKMVNIDGQEVRIQLWDLAGQDRLGGVSRLYCRDAHGAIVVTDITRQETLDKAIIWKSIVDEQTRTSAGNSIPMILCVNKFDLAENSFKLNNTELQTYANENKFSSAFFTSAKTGLNSEIAVETLVRQVLKNSAAPSTKVEESISYGATKMIKAKYTKKKNCC